MKLKFLLLLLFVISGALHVFAQSDYDYDYNPDTVTYLIISEARLTAQHYAYVEITNIHPTESVDLAAFEFGSLDPWTDPWDQTDERMLPLPHKILWPGESYVMATVYDLPTKMQYVDPEKWEGSVVTQEEMWELADLQIHVEETGRGNYTGQTWIDGTPMDSVSPAGENVMATWNGRDAWFLRQHLSELDSVVIDQVNADFSTDDGQVPTTPRDVAGIEDATYDHVLIRKYSVQEGDLLGDDWPLAVGTDIEDSEWIPVPVPRNGWGQQGIKVSPFWTIGNHGDYTLDPNSFESDVIDINFTDTVMTVPWGLRNDYVIMSYFEKSPGIAWDYQFSPNREDSAFVSARTGDVLRLYVCGSGVEIWDFDIVVTEPTDDANIVIPKNMLEYTPTEDDYLTYEDQSRLCNVTWDEFGMDTIYDVGFATRVDTLLAYLEKAPEATWEVVNSEGEELGRPDLVDGDQLIVTAKDKSKKTYYIKVDEYIPDHDAYLSSITWPDIPDYYHGILGWEGDTIPGFTSAQYAYELSVFSDVEGIPALVAKPEEVNTKVEMIRAKNLTGTRDDRTVTINTVAQDDTSYLQYTVVLEKELDDEQIQPFNAEPFFSQRGHRLRWYASAMEICNPGNQPIDMSDYMIVRTGGGDTETPATAIESYSTADDFDSRYCKYIPGRIWDNEANWQVEPALAIMDYNVNTIVEGGDVFVIAASGGNDRSDVMNAYMSREPDVQFWPNPWGDETITDANNGDNGGNPVRGWTTNTFYLFKIVGDSIKDGKKPATDPDDFELIDVFGNGDGTSWVIGGKTMAQNTKIERLPQYWQGNTTYAGSFSDLEAQDEPWYPQDEGYGEWAVYDRTYYGPIYGWPAEAEIQFSGLGMHTFDPITVYKSTITSNTYIVSPGYTDETIRGVVSGTTVDQFLAEITKADEGQTLVVKSGDTEITGATALSAGDVHVLEVTSADGQNKTPYTLNVTADGLSNDAVLTSTVYDININGANATISGMDINTLVSEAKDNVTAPENASSFTIVDAMDRYVPLKKLNYDTAYVDVKVKDQTYFEVIAEDGVTKILYQLVPNSEPTDAYVLSDVYEVDQDAACIMYVPRGTDVTSFIANLIPAPGATVKIVDKVGNERTISSIRQDDKVVVTSQDGTVVKVYYLSMLIQYAGYGESNDYFAYVLSSVYDVDQLDMKISGSLTGDQSRVDFVNNLIPSFGASVTVINADGIESTTDDLNQGDRVQVTSFDGKVVVYYVIEFATGFSNITNDINLYPNPTTGMVNISGIESGNRVRVFNAMGANIKSFIANSTKATFSLNNQPAGMYLIMVDNNQEYVGKFKVIKK